MNCLRVARLTGDIPKEDKLSVARVVGRDKKRPGLLQAFFKKKELVEYIFHEGYLLDKEMHGHVAIFETPHRIAQKFAASGAEGLVASHRMLESGGPDGMESLFALQVAGYREEKDPKTQAMIDVVWPVWSGAFDDEIVTLTEEELQPSSAGFLWHKYLNESNQEVGARYRAFVAASTGGPIPERPELDRSLGLVGSPSSGTRRKRSSRSSRRTSSSSAGKPSSSSPCLPLAVPLARSLPRRRCSASGTSSASGIASRGRRATSARSSFQPSCSPPT